MNPGLATLTQDFRLFTKSSELVNSLKFYITYILYRLENYFIKKESTAVDSLKIFVLSSLFLNLEPVYKQLYLDFIGLKHLTKIHPIIPSQSRSVIDFNY